MFKLEERGLRTISNQIKSNRRSTTPIERDKTKSLEKVIIPQEEKPSFYICATCGTHYKDRDKNFPASQSEIYAGNGYKLTTCKKCLDKLYQHYCIKLGDEDAAIRRVCMKFDIYFNQSLANASRKITKDRSRIHTYVSRANLVQYKDKSYDTTIDEEQPDVIETLEDIKEKDLKVTQKIIKFWGLGFEQEDYVYLQDQYVDWTTRHECKTKAQEEVFKRLCFKQLEILKATRNGESTKDLDKTYQDLLDTANLKPKQTNSDALAEDRTFGQLIKIWENENPIPEPSEEFKDVDKIGRYISVFFLGHLAKMVGIKNKYARMYEEEMSKYTVVKPEYEEDTEALFDAIFGEHLENGDNNGS